MQDRQPGAPGQYKATLTAAEFQKMQAGEQFTITMTRDDQPIVEGTPYSKAAVLPDELAKIICPDVLNPTPADAFRALQNGKAPAGFGLGKASTSVPALNTCLTNGWYWIGADAANAPPDLTYAAVHVRTRLDGQVVQTLFGFNQNRGCQMIRHTLDGGATWIEEWVNPPMYAGYEYRTTERCDGKAVYRMRVNCGTLPNATSKSVSTIIPGTASIISAVGIAVASSGESESLPVISSNGAVKCSFFVTAGRNITVNAYDDMSAYAGYITVAYTKD